MSMRIMYVVNFDIELDRKYVKIHCLVSDYIHKIVI